MSDNMAQTEAEYAVLLEQWSNYHNARLEIWETLAAMRAAGVEIRSWLANRRWADMYRNDALQEWIGALSPAARLLATECRGCLRWVLLGPDFDHPTTAIAAGISRSLVKLRFVFYRGVVDLAHRWVADRGKMKPSDRIDLVTEAEIECLHAIETWWPDHGRFSTWLYSRLQGTYTARLRELKKAPIPDLAVTLSGLNLARSDEADGDDAAAFAGAARPEVQTDPWDAAHAHMDSTRTIVRARASLGIETLSIQVCETHLPLLTRKWRSHTRVGKAARRHDCDLCAMVTRGEDPERRRMLEIGGFLRIAGASKPRRRRRVNAVAAAAALGVTVAEVLFPEAQP